MWARCEFARLGIFILTHTYSHRRACGGRRHYTTGSTFKRESKQNISVEMPEDNCLVCATNEGVFVDIEKQPELKDKAKNCRLDKVWDESETNKICHKCAFEIDQCNLFIEKVKKASIAQNAKEDSCVLCLNTPDKIYLFDLSKQKNGVNGLFQRLQDQFSDELKNKELKKQFICLSCRYCVDLLADLKTLLDEVPDKLKSIVKNGIDPADLPKTKTIIASRKTTYIQSSNLHLNTPSDTDSDTSISMANKKKVSKKSKSSQSSAKCGQCKTAFSNSIDTYRLFKTGKTLCKQCWLSTDFNKATTSKKRKKTQVNYPTTKLCSIVLKDLYRSTNDSEYTIIEDKKGNIIFKVTGDEISHVQHKESDNRVMTVDKSPKFKARQRKESEKSLDNENVTDELFSTTRQRKDSEQSKYEKKDEPSISKERKDSEKSEDKEDISVKFSRTTRVSKDSEHNEEEEVSVKSCRTTRHRKDSEQSIQENIEVKSTRATRQRKDSDQSVQEIAESRPIRSARRRKESEQSVQEDYEKKPTRSRSRKNSELSVQSIQSIEVKPSRRDSEKSEQEEVQIDIDVDSDEGPSTKRAKKSSAKSESTTKSKVQNTTTVKRKRGRSSSIESIDSRRMSTRNVKKHTQALEEIIEIDDDVSDTDKVEKELTRPKRSRKANTALHDERSDTELHKVESNKSSPMSSKEPTPERQPLSPSRKETDDSTNVTEIQTNVLRSKEFESSESEEIDILKSTDEESKHDESLDKGNGSKAISDIEIDSEHDVADKLVEKVEDSVSKCIENSQLNDEINEDAQSNVSFRSIDQDEPETIEENTKEKSVEKDVIKAEENDDDNDASMSKNKSDVDDQDMSDDGKENKVASKKRSLKKNARKSKSITGKKSEKCKMKDIVSDVSDSEQTKFIDEPIVITYTCNVCEQIFDKKYDGLLHEITHAKYLKVLLEKVIVPERRKSNVSDGVDEKMDVDEDTEVVNEVENDEDVEKTDKTEVLNKEKENENIEIAEVNDKEPGNNDDLDRIDTVNEDDELDKVTDHNESETEVTPNSRGRRAFRRHSSKVSDEKRQKKTRGRRKTATNIPESEVTTAVIEAEPDKIAEAVQETLNDMAELHERIQEESTSKNQEEDEVMIENQKENKNITDKEPEVVSNDEAEVETVEQEVESGSETEVTAMQNADIREQEIETHDIADDSSRDEVICESNTESRDAEPEEPEHPVVNLDDEASRDVVDVESEAKKRSEESEIEITEVEDVEAEDETVMPDEVVECEQVDLTERDNIEDASKADNDDDDNDIEEIIQEPDRNVNEDDNTVDSVTEINVTTAAEPTVENDAENPKPNDDTDNTTEDEALAQESLEDLLQRKGLQVVDEFAESVTDGEDESEKELHVSSEKENTPLKKSQTNNELEIKISDTECTEILEITNNKTNKMSVVGEVQITQDVDVVEEVVNDDDDVQPQNDVVEEVEVESNNVSFNFPKLY
ncbi:cingulin-like [Phymastichus coffea]|uniref:cingulin-like n=1 Tax=Phymastichus coffea TaxID=108790 RepID=UPI00273CD6A1|nr:cingulin-like [Phymastichus coffea]